MIPIESVLPNHFQSFIKSNLIYLNHSITYDGIGVFPSIDLEPETILASYPLTHYYNQTPEFVTSITFDTKGTNDDEEDDVDDLICNTDEQTIILAEWLLHEVSIKEASKYYEWIKYLPKKGKFNLFNDQLKNKLLLKQMKQMNIDGTNSDHRMDIRKEFSNRDRIVKSRSVAYNKKKKKKTTLEMYQWAISIVLSRSFDDDGERYLLPGLDFFNHCNDEDDNENERTMISLNVDVFNGFIIFSTKSHHPINVELCINYSKEKTLSWKNSLFQYGF